MDQSAKRTTLLVLIVFAVCIGTAIGVFIKVDRSFDQLPHITHRAIPLNWATNIKIGVIGDSWVSGKKLDGSIAEGLRNAGIEAEVVSSGQPGANSRRIYRNMFLSESKPYCSSYIVMDEDVDYLVVIAGVNDTIGHIGKEFYAHHIFCIVRAAQERGIHSVVLEVPEYGIEYAAEGFTSSGKHLIYKVLFDGMKDDVISDYREALQYELRNEIHDNVTMVHFWSYVEKRELYANPTHLNAEGSQELGTLIAENIGRRHNHQLHLIAEKSGSR
jgi:lysophospholipase L1-like esterase